MTTRSMISFDWALKRLLRNKANFEVLEGFLSELIRRKIIIQHIADSESNQEEENSKYNRVDIFVEFDNKELVIIELQVYGQDDYFKRMLYGVSKSITEHIYKGDPYSVIRKVYSVNIVYFDLGVGEDYIYHGITHFTGLHTHDELHLTTKQQLLYGKTIAGELYPEYYIIKVKKFDDMAKDTLDEWIYYLKNNKIRDDFTAQGIDKAREILAYDNLSDEEKRHYEYQMESQRNRDSEVITAFTDGEIKGSEKGRAEGEAIGIEKGRVEGEAIGIKKGRAEGEKEKAVTIAVKLCKKGASIEEISELTGLTIEEITGILKQI